MAYNMDYDREGYARLSLWLAIAINAAGGVFLVLVILGHVFRWPFFVGY